MEIKEDITIPDGVVIHIKEDVNVSIKEDVTFTNNGEIDNKGNISGNGNIDNNGKIDNTEGTLGDGENNLIIDNENGGIEGGNIAEGSTVTGGEVAGEITNNGTIINETGEVVPNATFEIVSGNKVIATGITDENGNFIIKGIETGRYNVVITDKNGNKTTQAINISDSNLVIEVVEVNNEAVTTIVSIKDDIPNVVVDNISSIYGNTVNDSDKGVTKEDKEIINNNGNVVIEVVASMVQGESDDKKVELIAENKNDSAISIVMTFDFKVIKTLTTAFGEVITTILKEVPEVLTFYMDIPEELRGKSTYVLYRYHEDSVDTITTLPNSDGEFIELSEDGKTVIMHVKKFSVYAIGASEDEIQVEKYRNDHILKLKSADT